MLSSNLKRKLVHKFYESLGFDRHGYSFLVTFKAQQRIPGNGTADY
jgi:hypothetical protein